MAEVDPLATQRDSVSAVTVELAADGFEGAIEIGRGGFGVVYRCLQPSLDRTVAIKVLTADLDQDGLERFVREQQAMGRLSGHPNIVNIHQVGATRSGRPYIVMQYHPGGSVEERIRRVGPFDWGEAVGIGVKLAGALETAHRLGILHRDVKPANILITDYGEPQLTDFGIARITGGFETSVGTVSGSPAFTAPEVLQGEPSTPATDVYGLGATLFCAITGHAAFERRSGEQLVAQFLRITTQPIPNIRGERIPPKACDVIERAMASSPADRPATAAEFGAELQEVERRSGLNVQEMVVPGAAATTSPGGELSRQARPSHGTPSSVMVDDLERGRAAYRAQAWDEAYALLSDADESVALDPDDLEALAESAHFTGRSEQSVEARTRLYNYRVRKGDNRDAAMCAFRIHIVLMMHGDLPPAMGWFARAQRLLQQEPECAVHGYLCVAEAEAHFHRGNLDGSLDLARRATTIGTHFADPDPMNIGLHQAGRVLVALGDIDGGTTLLDEAMVAVVAREVNATSSWWIYCSSINVCEYMSDFGRASAWTSEFEKWVRTQHGATAMSGSCRMHRSRILRLHGEWTDAEREARQACAEQNGTIAMDAGQAWYEIGEIRRLVGDLPAAEEAFGHAGGYGWDVQPGMALLRAAQGRTDAAAAGLARALAEHPADRLARAKLLPAQAEIAIASGNLQLARAAAEELAAMVVSAPPAVRAAAAQIAGAVRVADGDPAGALPDLRAAVQIWADLDVPYEAARSHQLIGLACRAIGDEDTARLEWETCRAVFSRLGAVPDLQHTDELLGCAQPPTPPPDGLSAREVEVLRLVAAGLTNQDVAEHLSLSRKTVARHLSNIFAKIGVTSRAAATAYTYQHGLD
ncbi:protein kinase domain-containing protein [Rhodococcus opacus]|uniref:protein kinase domain-containing protein n=1 Tax=Rhodococcus opacus TaxID=37919 RepID=UPI002948EDDC|nr:protein kinase [Rhodococcus opacus]MDV6248046.1 protein kinase [Rhodococcus opacus]